MSIISVGLAVVAIGLAWWIFVADPERRLRLAGTAPGTRALLADQYRFDEVYEEALIQPGRDLGDVLTNDVERYAIQGTLEGVVRGVIDTGRGLRVAADRPRALLRLRDGRGRGGGRDHLLPGDALVPWLSAIVLLPLIGALSMLAVPSGPGGLVQARIHAIITAGTTAVLVGILIGLFDRSSGELQFVDHVSWVDQVGLSWDVGVDGISLWLIALTAGIFFLAIVTACWRLPERARGFLGMLLLAEAGLLGLFAAGDLVLFYVFWEAMLVPFYFLIGMWGGEGRARATTKFVIYTMVGSLLMLVSILATAFVARDITGQFTFSIRDLSGVAFTDTQSTWLFLGFALAFAIKLPLWPFHAWLPDAYRAAPILVTGLLAAVMSKAGVYGFLRIGLPLFPEGADRFAIPLGGARGDRHRLRLAARLARPDDAPARGVLEPRAPGLHPAGHRRLRRAGVPGRRAPDGQPRHRRGGRVRDRRDHQPHRPG